jgi:hypothetical protein
MPASSCRPGARVKNQGDGVQDALLRSESAEQDGKVIHSTFARPTGTTWLGSELPLVRVEFE